MRKFLSFIVIVPTLLAVLLVIFAIKGTEVDPLTGKEVMRMSQAERKAYSDRKATSEALASDTLHAQKVCALKLGIPYNEAWPVVATKTGYRVIYMTGKSCEVQL